MLNIRDDSEMQHKKAKQLKIEVAGTGRTLPLSLLVEGERGRVSSIEVQGSIRRRLLDLGLIEGTQVVCLHRSVRGDPIAYSIRGAAIALRLEDSSRISVLV